MDRSETQNSLDDPSNPFFLHYSLAPAIPLVSQLLTGDNYVSWSRAFLFALSAKNKQGFIDGSILKPESDNQHLLNLWIRNNNIVISWILSSVSKEIAASLLYSDTAAEIWEDLKERFLQSNAPKIFQLRQELSKIKQDSLTASQYYTKLKGTWEELNNFRPNCNCGKCTCGAVKQMAAFLQTDYTMTFLMGLGDSFTQTRAQILLMDPLPTIGRAFALVSQEEIQRNITQHELQSNKLSDAAFVVNNNYGKYNYNKKNRPFCTHCNIPGHTKDKCYKIHGFPPGYKPRPRNQQQRNVPTNQVQVDDPPSGSDIGSNSHGFSSSQLFFNSLDRSHQDHLMKAFAEHLHTVPNGSKSSINSVEEPQETFDWQG